MWRSVVNLQVLLLLLLHQGGRTVDANCNTSQLLGDWVFDVGDANHDNTINCFQDDIGSTSSYRVTLNSPNVAVDEFGNDGFWTDVTGLGFEVVIRGRKFYAFEVYGSTDVPCGQTLYGSSHDVLGRNWACFRATSSAATPPVFDRSAKKTEKNQMRNYDERTLKSVYGNNKQMIAKINSQQTSWRATEYKKYDSMTVGQMLKMAGNRFLGQGKVEPKPASESLKKMARDLSTDFDWRNVNGKNFVTPVRDQMDCGSCYIFSALGMLESRLAIATNKRTWLEFSTQDAIDCAVYGNGCNGGSDFLISGKYAEDFGLVEEMCNPYVGHNLTSCSTDPTCPKYYATGYEFIGGYYGGCCEEAMMLAIANYGPITVDFAVFSDLFSYKTGVYSYTGTSSTMAGDLQGYHAVVAVGYGVDPAAGKFWIIKNSWGPEWGENGYFRIRRGSNECEVEASASHSFPII